MRPLRRGQPGALEVVENISGGMVVSQPIAFTVATRLGYVYFVGMEVRGAGEGRVVNHMVISRPPSPAAIHVLRCFCLASPPPPPLQVVRFVPPLVATAADVSMALSIIDQALSKVTGGTA